MNAGGVPPAGQSRKPEIVLSVRGLRVDLRRLGGAAPKPLLSEVDLDLRAGRITGLAGESGSGKSLTLLALMGLLGGQRNRALRMRAERLRLADRDLLALDEHGWRSVRGRMLTMIFQDPGTALDPVFRIGAQIEAALRRTSSGRGETGDRCREALAAVGFADPDRIRHAYPHQLSGGMRQLALIAMARAVGPRVLLADEPTTALDMNTQDRVLAALEDTAREDGAAILLVSHDLRVLASRAEDIIVLHEGRVVERAPGPRLLRRPAHPVSAGLVEALPRLGRRPPADLAGRSPDSPQRRPAAPPLLAVRSLTCTYGRRWHRGLSGVLAGGPSVDSSSGPGGDSGPGRGHDRCHNRGRKRGNAAFPAVRQVDLELAAGEILGLAGESGSGKSTLARALVGLVRPASGQILFRGVDLDEPGARSRTDASRRLQIVFQDPGSALSPRRTIAKALEEPLALFRLASREAWRERSERALEAVGLGRDCLPRYPHEFSSGQRQRIAIARALICEPDVLVADEAVAALDLSVQAQVVGLLQELRRELGIAILFISHDLAVICQLADRVAVMRQGQLVEEAEANRLFSAPKHPYTRSLLDSAWSLEQASQTGPASTAGTAHEDH